MAVAERTLQQTHATLNETNQRLEFLIRVNRRLVPIGILVVVIASFVRLVFASNTEEEAARFRRELRRMPRPEWRKRLRR